MTYTESRSLRQERIAREIRIRCHSRPAQRGQKHVAQRAHGEKVAIVTAKPQTTRNRIIGVLEVPAHKGTHPAAQIVFVDTPGVHKPASQLDRRMLQEVHEALESRDLVLVLMDATRRIQVGSEPSRSRIRRRQR
jgi:GTPase